MEKNKMPYFLCVKHWHDSNQQSLVHACKTLTRFWSQQSLVDACKTKKENQTLNCIQINNLGGLNAKINKLSISKSNIYKVV